jgi:hypothetical protein
MSLWRLAVAHTHLYAGARLRCLDAPSATTMAPGDRVVLEFSDGNVAPAAIQAAGPVSVRLDVPAHRTGHGTAIGSRRWMLVPGASAGELTVKARAS